MPDCLQPTVLHVRGDQIVSQEALVGHKNKNIPFKNVLFEVTDNNLIEAMQEHWFGNLGFSKMYEKPKWSKKKKKKFKEGKESEVGENTMYNLTEPAFTEAILPSAG